jgi:hypothetical protein
MGAVSELQCQRMLSVLEKESGFRLTFAKMDMLFIGWDDLPFGYWCAVNNEMMMPTVRVVNMLSGWGNLKTFCTKTNGD